MVRALITVYTALSLIACTTLRPVAEAPADWARTLKAGDHVQLVTSDQRQLQLEITVVASDALQGTDAAGQPVSVPFDQIASAKQRVFAAGRTTWLVVGIVGVAVLAGGGGGLGGSGSGVGEDGY